VAGVRVIRNPVDTSIFHPGEGTLRAGLAVGAGDIVVAHVSNLKAQKRPLDIVVAAETALARDPRLLFVIAGEGRCRAELESEASARGLAERFRFLGWIEHRAVAELFRSADMLVMPSWFEAQALVYLEAQACGCALIASDIPAARVVVEHGVDGMLFPLGDTDALAAAIVELAVDRPLREALVVRALDQVGAHSLPLVTDEYELAFRSLIADKPA
jgi:glycosyltransferase involved in cell wall biosynthesis